KKDQFCLGSVELQSFLAATSKKMLFFQPNWALPKMELTFLGNPTLCVDTTCCVLARKKRLGTVSADPVLEVRTEFLLILLFPPAVRFICQLSLNALS